MSTQEPHKAAKKLGAWTLALIVVLIGSLFISGAITGSLIIGFIFGAAMQAIYLKNLEAITKFVEDKD